MRYFSLYFLSDVISSTGSKVYRFYSCGVSHIAKSLFTIYIYVAFWSNTNELQTILSIVKGLLTLSFSREEMLSQERKTYLYVTNNCWLKRKHCSVTTSAFRDIWRHVISGEFPIVPDSEQRIFMLHKLSFCDVPKESLYDHALVLWLLHTLQSLKVITKSRLYTLLVYCIVRKQFNNKENNNKVLCCVLFFERLIKLPTYGD